MNVKILVLVACCVIAVSCAGGQPATNSPAARSSNTAVTTPTPAPQISQPRNGDYNATGVVTKIDMKLGSVEMDHEDIPGLMPPMRMEFYVSDKKMLEPLNVGDKVDFILRYKDGSETVVKINKAQ